MSKTTRTTILRKPSKAELAALKEEAKFRFMNTAHGYNEYAYTDPKSGRGVSAWVEGAYIHETVVSVTDILRVYHQKLDEGYKIHELGIQPFFQAVQIYFYRPQEELDAELEKIYQRVTDEYNESIKVENDEIVERQVQLLLAAKEKREVQQKAVEQQQEAERIRVEVEAELRGLRQQVEESLGVAA